MKAKFLTQLVMQKFTVTTCLSFT